MKTILIVNGPNLNLLGHREPEIYGTKPLEEIVDELREAHPRISIEHFQSNHEGDIIDALHRAFLSDTANRPDGIILNAGAFTHTSLAIADAIKAIDIPVVEVHLSNVYAREPIRSKSLIAPACIGSITGFGANSYNLAVLALLYRQTI